MKAGCAISLATFAVTGGAYYAWLRGRFDPPGDWIAALIGGFLMMMVAGLLQNAHLAWRDQGVMDRAHRGEPDCLVRVNDVEGGLALYRPGRAEPEVLYSPAVCRAGSFAGEDQVAEVIDA